MIRARQSVPKIKDHPAPQFESIEYSFSIMAGFVFENGSWTKDYETTVEEPTVEAAEAILAPYNKGNSTRLSWVEFFQKATVVVRHPERFEGDRPGPYGFLNQVPGGTETLRGALFTAAPAHFVTAVDETGIKLATSEEVIAMGKYTPFMERWLRRYALKDNTSGFNDFIVDILPVAEPDLRLEILNNKFSSLRLEDM